LLNTNKVEIDIKDNNNQTPMGWAARNGHDAIVKLLLDTETVDVNLKDTEYGLTPLSWVARNGNEVIIKLLFETGKVKPNLEDRQLGTTVQSYGDRA
jgi:ankyrin repeat protein